LEVFLLLQFVDLGGFVLYLFVKFADYLLEGADVGGVGAGVEADAAFEVVAPFVLFEQQCFQFVDFLFFEAALGLCFFCLIPQGE
jgi:hypothetical protein